MLSWPPSPIEKSHVPLISSYVQLAGVSALTEMQEESRKTHTEAARKNAIWDFDTRTARGF